jgi:hypothetical protein
MCSAAQLSNLNVLIYLMVMMMMMIDDDGTIELLTLIVK